MKSGESLLKFLYHLTLHCRYPDHISDYIEDHKNRSETKFPLPKDFGSKVIDLDRLFEMDLDTRKERSIRSVHRKVNLFLLTTLTPIKPAAFWEFCTSRDSWKRYDVTKSGLIL